MPRYDSDSDSSHRSRSRRKKRKKGRRSSSSSSSSSRSSSSSEKQKSSSEKSRRYKSSHSKSSSKQKYESSTTSSRKKKHHKRSSSQSKSSRSRRRSRSKSRSSSRSSGSHSRSKKHVSRSKHRSHRSSSRSNSRSRASRTSSRHSRSPSHKKSKSKSESSKLQSVENVSRRKKNEDVHEKLQAALKAAAEVDGELRQKGILPPVTASSKGQESSGMSVSDQIKRAQAIDDINSNSFVQQEFTSSRNWGKKSFKPTDEIVKEEDQPTSSAADTTSNDATNKMEYWLEHPECLVHKSLFEDTSIKMDKWKKKLIEKRKIKFELDSGI